MFEGSQTASSYGPFSHVMAHMCFYRRGRFTPVCFMNRSKLFPMLSFQLLMPVFSTYSNRTLALVQSFIFCSLIITDGFNCRSHVKFLTDRPLTMSVNIESF